MPPAAADAWRAYRAMLESKDAHFAALQRLDEKRQAGAQRTLAEVAQLDQLLAAHDRCVGAFASAMRDLDEQDRKALVAVITALNRDMSDAPTRN